MNTKLDAAQNTAIKNGIERMRERIGELEGLINFSEDAFAPGIGNSVKPLAGAADAANQIKREAEVIIKLIDALLSPAKI